MKIRVLLLAILVVLLVILSGCWDYMEYKEMALVSGVGIDYNREYDKVTVSGRPAAPTPVEKACPQSPRLPRAG